MAKWSAAHYNQEVCFILSVTCKKRPQVLPSLLNQRRNYYYYFTDNLMPSNPVAGTSQAAPLKAKTKSRGKKCKSPPMEKYRYCRFCPYRAVRGTWSGTYGAVPTRGRSGRVESTRTPRGGRIAPWHISR